MECTVPVEVHVTTEHGGHVVCPPIRDRAREAVARPMARDGGELGLGDPHRSPGGSGGPLGGGGAGPRGASVGGGPARIGRSGVLPAGAGLGIAPAAGSGSEGRGGRGIGIGAPGGAHRARGRGGGGDGHCPEDIEPAGLRDPGTVVGAQAAGGMAVGIDQRGRVRLGVEVAVEAQRIGHLAEARVERGEGGARGVVLAGTEVVLPGDGLEEPAAEAVRVDARAGTLSLSGAFVAE